MSSEKNYVEKGAGRSVKKTSCESAAFDLAALTEVHAGAEVCQTIFSLAVWADIAINPRLIYLWCGSQAKKKKNFFFFL